MIRPPRPDPLRDELSDQAKADLAIVFAELKAFYSRDYHLGWRSQERLRNVVYNRHFDLGN